MPRVEVPTRVAGRDAEVKFADDAPSELFAYGHDAEQLAERMAWPLVYAEQQIKDAAHGAGAAAGAPVRSVRRATARRASNRRATARRRQSDPWASIVNFLARHPGSTAGDLAKGLNLNPGSVSTRLTQLAKTGDIKRTSRGYSTTEPARARTLQPPFRRSR